MPARACVNEMYICEKHLDVKTHRHMRHSKRESGWGWRGVTDTERERERQTDRQTETEKDRATDRWINTDE